MRVMGTAMAKGTCRKTLAHTAHHAVAAKLSSGTIMNAGRLKASVTAHDTASAKAKATAKAKASVKGVAAGKLAGAPATSLKQKTAAKAKAAITGC